MGEWIEYFEEDGYAWFFGIKGHVHRSAIKKADVDRYLRDSDNFTEYGQRSYTVEHLFLRPDGEKWFFCAHNEAGATPVTGVRFD